MSPLLSVRNVKVQYPVRQARNWPWQPTPTLTAVNDISFDLYPGEVLTIVGESGCGKSSLAHALIGLTQVTSGQILFANKDLVGLTEQGLRKIRRDMQMVFQDPLASLNPRMTVGEIIAEPLRNYVSSLSKEQIRQRVGEMLENVGLSHNIINRYPHELSGGQCQRTGIARALVLKPKLVICDEPVSALDVSIQAQVVNLLKELQRELNLTLIFITHDLAIAKQISDRVMVMYLGHQMELAKTDLLYTTPTHPYTQALLSAVLTPDPHIERGRTIELLEDDLPNPMKAPSGCVFRTRCPLAGVDCALQKPSLVGTTTHQVACLKTNVPTNSTTTTLVKN